MRIRAFSNLSLSSVDFATKFLTFMAKQSVLSTVNEQLLQVRKMTILFLSHSIRSLSAIFGLGQFTCSNLNDHRLALQDYRNDPLDFLHRFGQRNRHYILGFGKSL